MRCKTAIVGIGETEFSDNSGRSEQRIAMEAVILALEDAGLKADDVEGIVSCDYDNVNQIELINSLGFRNVKAYAEVGHAGGAPPGAVAQAAAMIVSGMAKCVVGYRAMNERSQFRYGTRNEQDMIPDPKWAKMFQHHAPYGLTVPAEWTAIMARRRMIEFGETREQWGHIPVTFRKHANQNPHARFYKKTMTMEDYLAAPILADPLCRFDYCLETDGAIAFIVTSAELAKTLKQPPAYIYAAVQAATFPIQYLTNYYRESLTTYYEMEASANEIYKKSGLGPNDIDVAQVYDHFTPWVLATLEAFGFCKKGEAGAFAADGQIGLGGQIPLNTAGGHLSEGYIHGWSLINEGVRQARGTSTAQVKDCEFSLVTSACGCPTSAFILSR